MATIRFNTQFPGYEVLSELGRSNARILKARHLATGDLVAIKHFALNTDAETLRRFERESAIMVGIAHPNVVKVREVRMEAELPYIVMEFIEGGDLHHLIAQQERLDLPTLIRLGLQMASAFKAIHPQGIVHRDIKPQNILYRLLPSGELHFLLTDFGVARLHQQSNTLTGQSLMTYEYASPEQFNDPRAVDVVTDYYSLGVVLYECLHGRVPFKLDDHSGIVTFMNKVLSEAPPALTVASDDQLHNAFVNLLQGLLQKKAGERVKDPDELILLLKQVELNYLQANARRVGAAPAPLTPPAPSAGEPELGRTDPNAVVPAQLKRAATNAVVLPQARIKPRMTRANRLKLAALGLLLLGGFGLYFASSGPKSTGSTAAGTPGATPTTDTSAQAASPTEGTLARQAAEEKIRRDQRQQRFLAAAKALQVEVPRHKVGLLGGIKNVQIKISNPSSVPFSLVAVRVNYYKENNSLHMSRKVYFSNLRPYSSLIRKAPDSDRGNRLTCKIVAYESADYLRESANSWTPRRRPNVTP